MPKTIEAIPFLPHPDLQPYVSVLLYSKIDASAGDQIVDLFPVGHTVLSFAIDDLPVYFQGHELVRSKFNFTGQLTQYHFLKISGTYDYVYVIFKPYGAYRIFQMAQDKLVNNYFAMTDLPGKGNQQCLDKITAEGHNYENIVAILQEWLLSNLSENKTSDNLKQMIAVCDRIIITQGNISVDELCNEFGLSKTKLEVNFKEKIGMTPKLFSRIIRFNNVFETIRKGEFTDWQELVHKYNFFDQSHFIKDFKGFFNNTPSEVHASVINSAGLIRS